MTQENPDIAWKESDSALFIAEGDIYVPERRLQIKTIGDAIPATNDNVHLAEICCGEGLLSLSLLERFPNAVMHALDGSATMLESTAKTCAAHADRLQLQAIDIHSADWRRPDWRAHAVVSSLAIHHLDGPGKQQLFKDVFAMLAPGGTFVVADLMAPARAASQTISAEMWDDCARGAAEAKGDPAAFDAFQAQNWNYYADPNPDPIDKPSTLTEQLRWLAEAGFTGIDVHWLKAGHAIFSGVRS